jgi:pyridoxamine 5'-phosphate oxidase
MVILRAIGPRGVVFHTHYGSRKARELEANPRAALACYWRELNRQVRIEGPVEKLPAAESDAYFRTRPVGSRLSAWASPQSEVIPDRAFLERRVEELTARYRRGPIPRPPFWGGYHLEAERIEFWQAGPHRLHDRLLYTRTATGTWRIDRLAP